MASTGLKRSISKESMYFTIFLISIISYIGFLVFNYHFNMSAKHDDAVIVVLSWLGIFIGIYVVLSWYKLTGELLSLYTIFMTFFFLFNYGQPLMWAFGIHQADEIGQGYLYLLGKATSGTIIYTQMLILISIIMFHLGSVFCYKPKKNNGSISLTENKLYRKSIFYTTFLLSIIVIPVTFYNSIENLIYAKAHSYHALYYGEDTPGNSLLGIIQFLFFPCLVGFLVGSNYHRKIKLFVYIIFTFYLIINLLYGDRGSWIYYLLILIFMSHAFYKKLRWKKMFTYLLGGIMFLYFVDAIVTLRNTGISVGNVLEALSLKNSPIVSAIFEMGGSMQPTLVLIQYGWDIWPYGNTYLNSILGLVSSKIFSLFNVPFETVSVWFSQKYLGISYGAAFSIVAEPLINYGPIITPLFMVLMGYIITSLTYLDKYVNIDKHPLRVFFCVSTMSAFLPIVRNHSHYVLKYWFFGVLIYCILIYFMNGFLKKRYYFKDETIYENMTSQKEGIQFVKKNHIRNRNAI